MSSRLDGLDPAIRDAARALVNLASQYAYVTVTSGRRNYWEQLTLWLRYKRGQSTLPAAPPGSSLHERGLAFDMVTTPNINGPLGAIWNSWGGLWSPSDYVHFQARVT